MRATHHTTCDEHKSWREGFEGLQSVHPSEIIMMIINSLVCYGQYLSFFAVWKPRETDQLRFMTEHESPQKDPEGNRFPCPPSEKRTRALWPPRRLGVALGAHSLFLSPNLQRSDTFVAAPSTPRPPSPFSPSPLLTMVKEVRAPCCPSVRRPRQEADSIRPSLV